MENQPVAIKNQMLSLKAMSLRRVAINLWNESGVLDSIAYCSCILPRQRVKIWQNTVVSKVKKNLIKLDLPKSLLKPIVNILTPIGAEIDIWKKFHEIYTDGLFKDHGLIVHALKLLVWTTAGAIDYGKTGAELLQLETLDIEERYKLACLYCLVDYLPLLWEKLSEESRRKFTVEPVSFELVYYWSNILAVEESKLKNISERKHRENSFYQHAIEYSVSTGNKEATEYFLSNLSNIQRGISLQNKMSQIFSGSNPIINMLNDRAQFPEKKCRDVIFYLLTLISPEKQTEIIKKSCSAVHILTLFFDWPRLDVYSDNADFMWSFIPEKEYKKLQFIIEFQFRSLSSSFSNSFQKIFLGSPIRFRKSYACGNSRLYIFLHLLLLEMEDTESIKVFFRNLLAEDRRLIVYSETFFQSLGCVVTEDKWHLTELYLREATVSKDERQNLKFKETFTTFFEDMKLRKVITREGFYHFLNEIDKKRSLEVEIQKNVKKIKQENVLN